MNDVAPRADRSSKPRLLILTPDFPPAHGGVQVLVHRLALGLSGFEVEVVTLAGPGDRCFDGEGTLAVRRVGAHLGDGPARRLALNAAGLRAALRFRPDATLSAHVVTSPAAALVRRLFGGCTAQYFYANEILGKPRLAAFAATHADVAIAISAYTASLILATGASSANLRVIPPGVDLPDEPDAIPAERPTVLTVAQLKHRYKGHDVLVRAIARVRALVPDVEWVVIGEGTLRPELEALAASHGLEGCARFLGAVSDEQRNRWLRMADVFAMPSRLAGEGFGIVYLEANAFGKPVVAGNVAGPLDAVVDGVNGLLVDPTDALAVADAVTRLLLDRALARRLGRDGAARASDFAWPLIARRVETALLARFDGSPW
ncbi:MAG TPA: glycosyltransferase family 4 protein [Solirubrobacteraceae bacterium]|jgi:phosphatidylinositol alpha-1,6-mannosyltransferase|nr:glycosyltransferase family 4 protein [Solirubrobacteraceae bacterium]